MLEWVVGVVLAVSAGASHVPAAARCCVQPSSLMDVAAGVCVNSDGHQLSKITVQCNNVTITPRSPIKIVIRSDEQVILVNPPYEDELVLGTYCLGNVTAASQAAATEGAAWQLALLCADEAEEPAGVEPRTAGLIALVSIPFLVLTVAVYALLPELRDLQGKSAMCLCGALAVALSLLAHEFLAVYPDMTFCAVAGFVRYYFLLATFLWMNAITVQVFRAVRSSKGPSHVAFARYSGYAWGTPAALLALVLLLNYVPGVHMNLVPGIGLANCWFYGPLQTWLYFYGPLSISIAVNCSLFAWITITLWRYMLPTTLRKEIRCKLVRSLRLFVVLGVSWLFEPLSAAHGRHHIVWVVADVWNLLQGVLLFVVLVVLRGRARRGLAARGVLPCRRLAAPPTSAVTLAVLDSHILAEDDANAAPS